MEKIVEGFFDTYSDDFFEYFDNTKYWKLCKIKNKKKKSTDM